MSKKRDRLEIIRDILDLLRIKGDKVRPTHIMYKANLSHQMLTDYINELKEKDLIEEKKDKKNKKIFTLTQKGFKFLEDYSMIRKFMDSYGLE